MRVRLLLRHGLTELKRSVHPRAVILTRLGQTPIGDVHNVYNRVDPKIREEFEQRKILYVRNYNNGLGLRWQEVFQTEEPPH